MWRPAPDPELQSAPAPAAAPVAAPGAANNEDELVANLFRINQTKQRLIRGNVQGEKEAKDVHYEVGKKVRKAIADIGGMMPEEMPTPKKSLKELEREKKQLETKEQKKLEGIK